MRAAGLLLLPCLRHQPGSAAALQPRKGHGEVLNAEDENCILASRGKEQLQALAWRRADGAGAGDGEGRVDPAAWAAAAAGPWGAWQSRGVARPARMRSAGGSRGRQRGGFEGRPFASSPAESKPLPLPVLISGRIEAAAAVSPHGSSAGGAELAANVPIPGRIDWRRIFLEIGGGHGRARRRRAADEGSSSGSADSSLSGRAPLPAAAGRAPPVESARDPCSNGRDLAAAAPQHGGAAAATPAASLPGWSLLLHFLCIGILLLLIDVCAFSFDLDLDS
ncbi:unnamed protein product [Urochloa humidicola]